MPTRLLILFGFTLLACHAQQAPPSPPKLPHSLRLLCVEAASAADRLVILEKSETGWLPRWRLAVATGFLTDPLGFRSRSLALGIDPAPPAADGAFTGPARPVTGALQVVPFHEFQLPESDTATAVLIADPAGAASKRPYRVVLLDTNHTRFAAGSILLQNLTSSTVAGVFGGKPAKVAPGQAAVVEPGIDQAGDMAQITLARAAGDEWQTFCDTRWPAKTDYRRYLLLIPRQDGAIHPFVMPEHPPFR